MTEEGPRVHAYAAAGFTICGLETGGPISRQDEYIGPRLVVTAYDELVTCPSCNAHLAGLRNQL